MNKNEKFVITINRELGSGGRTVGRKLSEELVVDYYDKAVIKALQERYRLATEEIEGLKGRSHTVWAEMKRASAEMFETEQEILKSLAEEESCVVAGRSGFYVFRDHPNHLSVLIQASMPFRIERVMRKQNLSEEEARKTIEKVDKMRENYMKKYAKTSRYDTRNYDLVIKADGKTEDEIVDLILRFIG